MSESIINKLLKPHIEEQGELPILRDTVVDLLNAVESETTCASDVARIILRD